MTIRLEMLRAAGRAGKLLSDARPSVIPFVRSRYIEGGGYRGRGEAGDLYYTVFAMETLLALEAELPRDEIEAYLRSFEGGESLDLVHLACLARCWANLPGRTPPREARTGILERIEGCRRPGGGYGASPGSGHGSSYHAFLAFCAYQDLEEPLPDARGLAGSVQPYAGDPTPLLAGAAVLLSALGTAAAGAAGDAAEVSTPAAAGAADVIAGWLLGRHHERGGFFAIPQAPLPDLLSTATALHALAGAGISLDAVRPSCLAFVKSLWSDRGGFHGMEGDGEIDCEYTYYGLLALGHLAP